MLIKRKNLTECYRIVNEYAKKIDESNDKDTILYLRAQRRRELRRALKEKNG